MAIETLDREDDFSGKYAAYRARVDRDKIEKDLNAFFQTPPQFPTRSPLLTQAVQQTTSLTDEIRADPVMRSMEEEGLFKRFIDDVVTGVQASPEQVAGGISDAANETLQLAEEITPAALDFAITFFDEEGNLDVRFHSGEALAKARAEGDIQVVQFPTADAPRSITGGLIRSTAQFLTGFALARRPVGELSGFIPGVQRTKAAIRKFGSESAFRERLASGLEAAIDAEIAGAAATMVVFDPHEDRLSTYLNEVPILSELVPDYLADNNPENETVWEGRIKNAIEGATLGIFSEGLFSVFRAYKGQRLNPDAPPDASIKVTPEEPSQAHTLKTEAPSRPIEESLRSSILERETVVPDELAESLYSSKSDKVFLKGGDIPDRIVNQLGLEGGSERVPTQTELRASSKALIEAKVELKAQEANLKEIQKAPLYSFDKGNEVSAQIKTAEKELAQLLTEELELKRGRQIQAGTFDAEIEGLQTRIKEIRDLGKQEGGVRKGQQKELAAELKEAETRLSRLRKERERAGSPAQIKKQIAKVRTQIKNLQKENVSTRVLKTSAIKKANEEVKAARKNLERLRKLKDPARKTNAMKFREKLEMAKNMADDASDLGNTEEREAFNLGALDPDDPIGDLLAKKMEENKALITKLKGGDKQTIKEWRQGAAQRLRALEEYLGRPSRFDDPEEVLAASNLLRSANQILVDRVQIASSPHATQADLARFGEMEEFYNLLLSQFEAGASKQGRVFRALREARENFTKPRGKTADKMAELRIEKFLKDVDTIDEQVKKLSREIKAAESKLTKLEASEVKVISREVAQKKAKNIRDIEQKFNELTRKKNKAEADQRNQVGRIDTKIKTAEKNVADLLAARAGMKGASESAKEDIASRIAAAREEVSLLKEQKKDTLGSQSEKIKAATKEAADAKKELDRLRKEERTASKKEDKALAQEQIKNQKELVKGLRAEEQDLFKRKNFIEDEVLQARKDLLKEEKKINITNIQKQLDIDQSINRMGGTRSARERARAILNASRNPASMNKIVRKLNQPTKADAIYETFVNGILSGPATHFRNIASNALVTGISVPEAAWNAAISKVFFNSEISFEEVGARAFGLKEGIRDGLRLVAHGREARGVGHLSDAFDQNLQIEMTRPQAISSETFKADGSSFLGEGLDMMGRLLNYPTHLLRVEDKFFKSIGYRMELKALALRKAMSENFEGRELDSRVRYLENNPPEWLHMEALDNAHYQTFTKKLGPVGQRITQAIRDVPMGRFVLPFIRTPTNILKFTFHRSPLAPMGKTFQDDFAAGGARAAQAVGRMSLGSSIMLGIGAMASEGIVTGAPPENKDALRALKATGWQPYSFKIGDVYVPFDRYDPIGNIFAWGATVGQMVNHLEEEDAELLIGSTVLAFSQNLVSQRYLWGLFEAVGAIDPSNPVKTPEGWFQRFLPSVIPYSGFLRGVARAIDPNVRVRRTAVGDEGLIEGINPDIAVYIEELMGGFRSNIPFMSATMPLDRDDYGEEILNPKQMFWGLDYLAPNWASLERNDKASRIVRENQIPLSRIPRQIMGVKLTAQEYSEYQRIAGETYKEQVAKLVNTPGFDRLSEGPEGMKAYQIKGLIRKVRAFARSRILAGFPELENRIVAKKKAERDRLLPPVESDLSEGFPAFPVDSVLPEQEGRDIRELLAGI